MGVFGGALFICLTISFNPINFRPHEYFAMSKVKSKIRKAKGRGEEEEGIGAASNNLEEKDLLCCLPEGQGTVGTSSTYMHNDDIL